MSPVAPLWVAGAYLLGSVSPGLIIARRRGADLRSQGSGNIGATNVGRVLGKRMGYLVLVLDALKGALPVLGARLTLGAESPWTAAVGVAAVVGHVLPIWHGLRGGKGAATAVGVILASVPMAGALAAATYVLLRKTTGRSSVGSLAGATVGWVATGLLVGNAAPSWMAGILWAIILVRHVDNLRRLTRGEEPPA